MAAAFDQGPHVIDGPYVEGARGWNGINNVSAIVMPPASCRYPVRPRRSEVVFGASWRYLRPHRRAAQGDGG